MSRMFPIFLKTSNHQCLRYTSYWIQQDLRAKLVRINVWKGQNVSLCNIRFQLRHQKLRLYISLMIPDYQQHKLLLIIPIFLQPFCTINSLHNLHFHQLPKFLMVWKHWQKFLIIGHFLKWKQVRHSNKKME